MTEILDRVVVPVASVADARSTGRALRPHEPETVVGVHVIEQIEGAPDTASPEQLEEAAIDIFEELALVLEESVDFETDLRYGTDVAETILDAADDTQATAIIFTPRGGSRWIRLLTGDVADTLVERTDRPVIVLPEADAED